MEMQRGIAMEPKRGFEVIRPEFTVGSEPQKDSAVIIGAGLGGLSAAIYLRLAGYQVSIYEANSTVGGRANVIEKMGYRFDTGPSLLNYPWVFENLFKAAGRNLADYVELIPVEPSVAFQWEDGTKFQLSSNLTNLANECERLEPGSRVGLLSFLQDAGAKYQLSFDKLVNKNQDNFFTWLSQLSLSELTNLSVWRSLDSELKRFFESRYIREALGSYAMYLGGSPFDLPGLFTILSYGELAYGLWLPRGGIYSLVEGIEKLALELGVIIYTNKPVKNILVKDNEVTGIKLSQGDIVRSKIVISNVDVPTTNSTLLKPQDRSTKTKQQIRRNKMTPGVITYYWGIKGKIKNLGHHTIYLPDEYRGAFDDLFKNKRIPENLPFYVSVPSETDRDLAPAGNTAMFILVPTPLLSEIPETDWKQEKILIKQRVLTRLKIHGIEIDESQIEYEEIFTPQDWAEKFGLFDGSAFGGAHTLFQVGPFRPRNYSSEIDGLYYTGASTTPGTGMPMVVLSGKLVSERILEHSKVVKF